MIKVLKKNGAIVSFDGSKIRRAIQKSAERVCMPLSKNDEDKVV